MLVHANGKGNDGLTNPPCRAIMKLIEKFYSKKGVKKNYEKNIENRFNRRFDCDSRLRILRVRSFEYGKSQIENGRRGLHRGVDKPQL